MKMDTGDVPGAHLRKPHRDGGGLAASFESDADNVKFSLSIPKQMLKWIYKHLKLFVKHLVINHAIGLFL
jgi:hypothetical protein